LFDDTGAPPASVATDPYAFLHVRADGALSPCGNGDTPAVEAGEEGFAGAWNSPVFREFRRGICAAGSIPECRACGVRGTRDPRTVDYLLASYDTGEPSGEYLAAVRAQLDALEDPATARALNAHVRGFEHWRGFVSLASYPHRMYIELTDECNLRCPMCTQSTLTGARKNMPMELFDKLRPLFRYTDMIHFTGCGEMFLHPQFRDMLSAAPNAEATVRIITNGLLLDEEMSRFLIAQKLKQFPRVLENIRTLVRLKRELGSVRPHVALNFVARRCNIEQLPDFVRMAENLGAESVNVGFLQVYSRDLASESLFFHQELSDRCMRMALDTAKETGVKVYLPGFFGGGGETEYRPLLTDSKCVEPYGFVYVRAEGTLGPCCVNDARLGLLAGNSFTDLWNGPEYRQFRRVVSTPEQDLNCQHCMLEGYKDIREVEHHLKLYNEANEVEDIDYEALAAQVANATS
jgi:MoaA/NifB/PqqE/SkfB family radical SAM enzyme